MEIAVVTLAVCLTVTGLALVATVATVIALWHRALKAEVRSEMRLDAAEKKIDVLDEAVAHMAELAGVPAKGVK